MVLVAVVVVASRDSASIGCTGSSARTTPRRPAAASRIRLEPFNPKHIILEVFGHPGTVATINYLDVNVQPQQVPTRGPAVVVDHGHDTAGSVQQPCGAGQQRSLGCRITVDGEVKDERIVNEVNAYTFCLVKSGMSDRHSGARSLARTIRRLAVPILLFWLALAAIPNIVVPQLEEVGKAHNVWLSSPMRRRIRPCKHIGKVFHEFDSDSSAMVVLEGDKPLGADAHRFYDTLVRKLEQDTKHVEHIQDFWGDPLTAAGSQSNDGKAAYVQVFLAGNQGEAMANESVDAIRDMLTTRPHRQGSRPMSPVRRR